MPTVTHDEARELLAAYALDAVSAAERAELDEHLATCEACADELARHREAAAFIAQSELPTPSNQWENIEAAITAPPPVVPLAPRRRTRTWLAAAGAAAVAAAAAVALTLVVVDSDGDGDVSVEAAARAAADEPGAQHVQLERFGGGAVMDVVVLPDGTAYLFDSRMAELPEDRTYQVWALSGDGAVSLGLLGPAPDDRRLDVPPGTVGLAVTEEPASGSVEPTGDPVASADLA